MIFLKFEIKMIIRIIKLFRFIQKTEIKINGTNFETIIISQTGDQIINVSEIGGNNVETN